ncbi:MAG: NAD(P)/FAD-dependent oxidoreductase [Vicinamibacteria bacterium]
MSERYDVVILGGGLAGLTLARHLLLETDKRILMLERRDEIPWFHQKVGESSVQLAGHYFGKVLDLERYLLHEHFMKYNLRFYFRSGARDNSRFEDYGHISIRPFSNVPSYQLNRNTLEAELLRLNKQSDRFEVLTGVKDLDVAIDPAGPHRIRYKAGAEEATVESTWVVDASGRNRFLARKLGLLRPMEIHNNTFFWWVEGTVDIEKLTDRSPREVRLKPERSMLGHLPVFLATNHFCAEGLWFWVIPLQGKTSLGLVYDSRVIRHENINSVEKATAWVLDKFPLFARDLPQRKVLDFGTIRQYSHSCERTISPDRWAMTGEAGRFTDPLYSPGSDLISTYNTMIVAAIKLDDPAERAGAIETYEQMMRALANAYVPSYAISYDCLGDEEAFSMKYAWELSVYFVAYVFPFINDLFADRRFLVGFMRFFSRLGPINQALHQLLSDFFRWKKENGRITPQGEPVFFDLMDFGTMRAAEKCFYKVGVSVDEARETLNGHLGTLEELARFIVAHVTSVVVGDERVIENKRFVEGIDLRAERLTLDDLRRRWQEAASSDETWQWSFDSTLMRRFRVGSGSAPALAAQASEVTM